MSKDFWVVLTIIFGAAFTALGIFTYYSDTLVKNDDTYVLESMQGGNSKKDCENKEE